MHIVGRLLVLCVCVAAEDDMQFSRELRDVENLESQYGEDSGACSDPTKEKAGKAHDMGKLLAR